jgi:hypothetical protein
MNYALNTFALSALILISLWASGQNFLSTKIESEKAVEDFEYFQNALEIGHPSLYGHTDSVKLQSSFGKILKQLSTSSGVSHIEFLGLLTEIMQMVGCGHSTILFPRHYGNNIDSVDLYLPLKVRLTENKIFVKENLSNADIPSGSEIISINGKSSSEIVKFLLPKIPADKGIVTRQIRFLEQLFPYFFAIYYGVSPNYEIKYAVQNDPLTYSKNIDALKGGDHIIKSLNQLIFGKVPLEFSIENAETAYLKITTFTDYPYRQAGINFEDTLSKIFKQLDSQNTKNLILDLRGNNGGNMEYGEFLFTFFIDKPTNYFGDAEIKKTVADGSYEYSNMPRLIDYLGSMYHVEESGKVYVLSILDTLQPNPNHFKGKLYILSNGLSYSSTACFIAHMKDRERGILIGEMPGGAYSGLNTQPSVKVVLPNSSFELFFNATHIKLNLNKSGINTPVDYEVIPSINNILDQIDVEKEYALRLISKQ